MVRFDSVPRVASYRGGFLRTRHHKIEGGSIRVPFYHLKATLSFGSKEINVGTKQLS